MLTCRRGLLGRCQGWLLGWCVSISRKHVQKSSLKTYMSVLYHSNVKIAFWRKRIWNTPIYGPEFKEKDTNWRIYQMDFTSVKVWCLCNREKSRNVWHTNPILSTEMSDSCVFSTSKIWHPKQTRKFYENLHFLLETFFSKAFKIFFMSPMLMFKVSKRCVLPLCLRRKTPKPVFFGRVDRLNEYLTRFGATCI